MYSRLVTQSSFLQLSYQMLQVNFVMSAACLNVYKGLGILLLCLLNRYFSFLQDMIKKRAFVREVNKEPNTKALQV